MATVQDTLPRHRLSVHDYHRMGEAGILSRDARVELIEGEIIDMAPIGSRHAGTVNFLLNLLNRAVGENAVVTVQNPIVLGAQSEPQPDLTLLRPRADFYATSHPQTADVLLVVEVADTSLSYDRNIKLPLYARHGIPEVWLIDVENDQLSIFDTPGQDGYQNQQDFKTIKSLTPQQLPDIEIDLTSLFIIPR